MPSPRCCSSAARGFDIDRHFVAMVELSSGPAASGMWRFWVNCANRALHN